MNTNRFLLGAALALAAPAAAARAQRAASQGAAVPIPQPDPDMAAVIDAYAGFRNAPVNVLTPDSARKQKSPDDAVKQVLLAQGRDTAPTALVRPPHSAEEVFS